jgi:hypothetical protein
VLAALAVLIAILPVAQWLWHRPEVLSAIWNGMPWLLAGVVTLRFIAAASMATWLYAGQLLPDRVLLLAALSWSLAVIALYGVLVWLADSPAVSRYFLAAVAVLMVPLLRVSAVPAALAWSRHR